MLVVDGKAEIIVFLILVGLSGVLFIYAQYRHDCIQDHCYTKEVYKNCSYWRGWKTCAQNYIEILEADLQNIKLLNAMLFLQLEMLHQKINSTSQIPITSAG